MRAAITGARRIALRTPRPLAALLVAFLIFAVPLAWAVAEQQGPLRIDVKAKMKPTRLPRTGLAPISVSVAGNISTTDESHAPALEELSIEINRHGHLEYAGLPVCQMSQIQPASSGAAFRACKKALVGQGKYVGAVTLPGEPPYPIEGQLLVFNGREHGHEVLLGHVFSATPFATSFVMVFQIKTLKHGTYGTKLTADMGRALQKKRSLSSIEMTLSRRYGRGHSFISAGCPAPKGFTKVTFPLARTTFSFAGSKRLSATVERECAVR